MIWRDVAGFEGRYEVSDEGAVRNASTGRTLKPWRQNQGYLTVSLGWRARRLVHRLVAQAFIFNPESKPETNHKNGKRDDNRAENLEWVTPSENHKHAHRFLPRKTHAKARPVFVGDVLFPNLSAAARALGVVDGATASAAARGTRCKGKTVRYA